MQSNLVKKNDDFNDPDEFLIRYKTLDRFLDILNSECLWFSRMDLLDDIKEGHPPVILYNEEMNETLNDWKKEGWITNGGIQYLIEFSKKRKIEQQKYFTFINCWCKGALEKFWMWKAYAGCNGVAIRTTKKRYLDSINGEYSDIDHGNLIYGNLLENMEFKDYIYQKGEYYRDENEYRFMLQRRYNHPRKGVPVKVDLNILLERVISGPNTSDFIINCLNKKLMKKKVNIKVKKSDLDTRNDRISL